MYIIWDTQSKMQVGSTYKSRKRAQSRADRLDLEYGAYRYTVRPTGA